MSVTLSVQLDTRRDPDSRVSPPANPSVEAAQPALCWLKFPFFRLHQ